MALQDTCEKPRHAVRVVEAIARQRKSAKVAKPHGASHVLELGRRHSAAVTSADDRSHARARNIIDWDVFFFQDLQHANMRDAARESTAQRDAERQWSLC